MDYYRDVSPSEAARLQERLCNQVVICPLERAPRTVGGVDVHEDRGAVAVLSYPDMTWVEGAVVERRTTYPYVPGLLAFREAPAMLDALERLSSLPDVILCDGQGLAHPRRYGLACHLGVQVARPTIGCAKSRLCGQHAQPSRERGAFAALMDGDQLIGAVLRTQTGVRPIYVSVGHLIDLPDAVRVTLACATRYRLPEPLRAAHHIARTGRCTTFETR